VPTKIPTATPSPLPQAFDYQIQPGDSLYALALRFNTTIQDILTLNKFDDPNAVAIGDILLIPGTPPPGLPSPAPSRPRDPTGGGFLFPIEGACLPTEERLMPNAPREYRAGIHEGIDFYAGYNCATIQEGTSVLAAKEGRIIRADHDYVNWTLDELNAALARSQAQGFTGDEDLDRFRGRQVWIDHGGGIITRYCHLGDIPREIVPGSVVKASVVVGFVGDSGTPESVTNPGVEIHLHWELRVGDSFLGAGLPADQVRDLYEQAFSN